MQPCKTKGLNWPSLHFSGGLLWMQRGISAMARSGGNTAKGNSKMAYMFTLHFSRKWQNEEWVGESTWTSYILLIYQHCKHWKTTDTGSLKLIVEHCLFLFSKNTECVNKYFIAILSLNIISNTWIFHLIPGTQPIRKAVHIPGSHIWVE